MGVSTPKLFFLNVMQKGTELFLVNTHLAISRLSRRILWVQLLWNVWNTIVWSEVCIEMRVFSVSPHLRLQFGHQFKRYNISFQYIIVRVRDRVWCERNKRGQRVVCNNTINASFVSLPHLNVFDIFRFKVFYWVYESYFLKKKRKERKTFCQ